MKELINMIIIIRDILGELNINKYTLNHFIKKRDIGGILAKLKNKNIQISKKLLEEGILKKKLCESFIN